MNKEEKEAIELLKQPPDFSLSYYKREHAIDIVLNLIEKQQKEIKELQDTLKCTQNSWYKEIENSVRKDKIREKIKKAKEINWHTPKLVIEYFEELLEEK